MLLARTSDGYQYVFDRPVRLLVVDDDPIMREFAVAQFSQPGATILTAEDGDQAWDLLQGQDGAFDLVLSDLEMPRCNGFMLVERIRSSPRHAQIPVVVITGRDDLFAIDRAYEVGATSFVTKPVNWRQLGYQLRYVLRTARMEAEIRQARDAAQRTAALRENLLGLLQHVTRTPLNAILGFGRLVRGRLSDPVSESHADAMLTAAEGLDVTLTRVFRYAQLTTGTAHVDLERVPVTEAVEAAVNACRALARDNGVMLAIAGDVSTAPVQADLRLLTVAVRELVANALSVTPAGGRVLVDLEESGEGGVSIHVRDEGPGLPEGGGEWLQRPFRPDQDLARLDGTTLGLGLPTAKAVAEHLGGRLTATSLSTGACFTLSLRPPAQDASKAGTVGAAA